MSKTAPKYHDVNYLTPFLSSPVSKTGRLSSSYTHIKRILTLPKYFSKMVKDAETVIQYAHNNYPPQHILIQSTCREFNELVNMSASELEDWLEGEASQSSGWSKDDGSETIGHESYNSLSSLSSLIIKTQKRR